MRTLVFAAALFLLGASWARKAPPPEAIAEAEREALRVAAEINCRLDRREGKAVTCPPPAAE